MKILISCLSRSWGGMEMFSLTTAENLIRKGHSVVFFCSYNSKIFMEAKKRNIPVLSYKKLTFLRLKEWINLIKELGNYDVVHTQASKDLNILVPALKIGRLKTPLLLTKRVGSYIMKKDIYHQWIYNRLTYALGISEVIVKNLVDTCPLTTDKVLLLHNGVDSKRFDPSKIDSQKVRNEFCILDDIILIGMLGRFSWGKGHEEFLFAASKLKEKYKNIKFMIIGEPSYGEEEYANKIKQMCIDYQIEDIVIFTGFRKDTPEVLAALDIFAFPSHSEAFGNALVEAMSMGKPSVCSASDGVLDIAVDSYTSYFFKKQDPLDFINKLEKLIISKELRESFGKNGRDRVLKNFDMEIYIDKLVAIYEKSLCKI
jgi:glycosyltransferase involved in cell wall biosynthesis